MKKNGLAALYVERAKELKNVYRGIEHEDRNGGVVQSLHL